MPRILITPANPAWPDDFARIRAELAQALGPLALRIDHIGSTSVPGLAAKDRIDVMVGVRALDPAIAAALQGTRFVHRPLAGNDHVPPGAAADAGWHKLFFRDNDSQPPVNVHVRVVGAANWRFALLFRDYLRADAVAREAYARLKRALAALHPDDIDAYTDVKDPACDLIIAGAEHWARASGWSA